MELNGTRCLVIGGAGSIGSHVVDQLVASGAGVTIYDKLVRGQRENVARALAAGAHLVEGDVQDRSSLAAAMAGQAVVFHLAAAWMVQCEREPRLALDVNIVGTFNVLEAAAAAGIRKVVFASAGAVYGEPEYVPVDERHPLHGASAYAASKIAGERLLAAFRTRYGLSSVGLRYFNVYGPRHDHHGNETQIIPRWLGLIERGQPPTIFGDGQQTMDFVYIGDVARATVLAATSTVEEGFFNVATGVETSAKELASTLLDLLGSPLQPIHQGQPASGPTRRYAATKRAEEEMGFRYAIPLREGLARTIAWRNGYG